MEEIRGVWIPNIPHSKVLDSQQNIADAMSFLVDMGFNAVFPVVWNQGLTLYRSEIMKATFGFEIDPHFASQNRHPLKKLIKAAHERGIAVIPWFEYGFACSARPDGRYILVKKPHYL
ncbi:family 10 glycosylhydrolase [Chroococcidiopsis sp. CCMEE 29]|uniref:family 10 glycosylhydrolase n=1 Tax=Chroococcidiopsis sp. CCMEE 29 TaxID=155894 RepID=UPI00202207E9|nr:family 10 glycosylhydrolase [Chroococcidiopsis sp. CCMEE 29]